MCVCSLICRILKMNKPFHFIVTCLNEIFIVTRPDPQPLCTYFICYIIYDFDMFYKNIYTRAYN